MEHWKTSKSSGAWTPEIQLEYRKPENQVKHGATVTVKQPEHGTLANHLEHGTPAFLLVYETPENQLENGTSKLTRAWNTSKLTLSMEHQLTK